MKITLKVQTYRNWKRSLLFKDGNIKQDCTSSLSSVEGIAVVNVIARDEVANIFKKAVIFL